MEFDCAAALLIVRTKRDEEVEIRADNVRSEVFGDTVPWRRFRWYRGQKHYSGSYWSTTESGHVVYESLLELSRLLLADFDPAVRQIRAQPCLIRARVNGKIRRHIPDYWLLTRDGPVLVAVKPAALVTDPNVAFTLSWVSEVAQRLGWGFEVASEPPAAVLENVRFLAGFRRVEWIDSAVLESLRGINLDGLRFGTVAAGVDAPEPLVRAGLLHLLWTDELVTELAEVLSANSVLHTRVGSA
ncbi:MAG TPA: TnsA-like heteromeric transposase endonuclease subunit [Mycobacterium sp.]|nr:TnsA-like heteromeric transposase endonuclease subunit [Mycobacterium sp.]